MQFYKYNSGRSDEINLEFGFKDGHSFRLKNQFIRDNEKYLTVVERNKENGKKGGRPKKETVTKNPNKPKKPNGLNGLPDKPKKADSVNGNEKDSKKDSIRVSSIVLPFQTDNFIKYWNIWKTYKKEQFKFTYKSEISEQSGLKKLAKDSGQNENIAIEMIEFSMAKRIQRDLQRKK